MFYYVSVILVLILCDGLILGLCKKRRLRIILNAVSYVIYFACVYWIAFGSRQLLSGHEIVLLPFAVYKDMLSMGWPGGSKYIMFAIVGNTIFFVPIGMLIAQLPKVKHKYLLSGIIGFVFSLAIEMTQYITMFGTFEVDDFIHNTWGAVIGCAIAIALMRKEKSFLANVRILMPLLAFIIVIGSFSIVSISYEGLLLH